MMEVPIPMCKDSSLTKIIRIFCQNLINNNRSYLTTVAMYTWSPVGPACLTVLVTLKMVHKGHNLFYFSYIFFLY